jgi:hypothetical protein
MANHLGTRWRGKLPVPVHAHPLVRKLFEEMNAQQTTISEVVDRAGLRRGTVSDWRYRREPTVSNLVAALNVLDLDLKIVKRKVART